MTAKIYDSSYIKWQIATEPRGSLTAFFKRNPISYPRAEGLSSAQLLYFMEIIAAGDDTATVKWLKAFIIAMKDRYTGSVGFRSFRKSWSHDILTVGLEYFGPEFIFDITGDWVFKSEYFQDIIPVLAHINAEQKMKEFLQ